MNAVQELKEKKGLEFNISYSRLPFLLRRGEENVKAWLAGHGLARDTPRGEVCEKAFGWPLSHMENLFQQAGLNAYWDTQFACTMDSHRLCWYAGTVSPEHGELIWRAMSRRYFEGKDTKIRPIRLDNHEMLLECAAEVGLDLEQARRVLQSDMYQKEILAVIQDMHSVGINSIPVLVFEVDGVADGSWLKKPRSKGRVIHNGSGNKGEFGAILQKFHTEFASLGV